MVQRRSAYAVLAAGTLLALVGCASSPSGPADPPTIHRGEVRTVALGSLTAQDIATAQTAFGIDLLHAVCAERSGENLALSPTSAAEALGMLYPAASGETAARIAEVLHLPAWSPDLVAAVRQHAEALAGLAAPTGTDLRAEDAPDSLRLSNRLWTAAHADPTQQYLDDVATAFGAQLESLDFGDDPVGSTDHINEQVSEDTAGLIEKLLQEPLERRTYAVLTNALHLDASWLDPFQEDALAMPFATPGGEREVEMMHGAVGTARATDGWVAVELPYRDGTLAALAVLPPDGTDPCAVTAGTLDGLADADGADASVVLPPLHIEQSHDLLDVLEALGLPRSGDFQGLGSADVAIDRIVQKTYLAVGEAGTEAAAATAVVMTESAAVVGPVAEVVFDRPFLLILTDTATGSPLFTAVVQDPSVESSAQD